jgi:hypothetical protein
MRLQPLIILLLAGSTSAAADQERGRIIPDDWTAESRASAQFLDQPRDDAFGPAVKLRRNAFG